MLTRGRKMKNLHFSVYVHEERKEIFKTNFFMNVCMKAGQINFLARRKKKVEFNFTLVYRPFRIQIVRSKYTTFLQTVICFR